MPSRESSQLGGISPVSELVVIQFTRGRHHEHPSGILACADTGLACGGN